jgi:alcohol dehydrogenase class IV
VAFGWGRRLEAGKLARALGRRAFLIHGARALQDSGAVADLSESLRKEGMAVVPVGGIAQEPEVADVDRMAALLRGQGAASGDFVVALGGGSTIDLAKASCAMATNRAGPTVKDYLEGVGSGLELTEDPLPLMVLPTTAGTGSEATKNAVISNRSPPFKRSLRSDRMMARVVLIDPELTVTLPPDVTAATGMDAITQLIESYISLKAAPIPQALSIQGLALAAPSLPRAFRDGSDREAREKMAHAAFLSGLALANSGLGMAHGVAAALGIHSGIAHGLACAVMLPVALEVNSAVRPVEISRLAEALCGRPFGTPEEGARAAMEKVRELCDSLGIPRRLGQLGVRKEALPALVKASQGSSMSGNPRRLSEEELGRILESIL